MVSGIRLDHTHVMEGQWVIHQYRNARFRRSITCGSPAPGTAAGCIAARLSSLPLELFPSEALTFLQQRTA